MKRKKWLSVLLAMVMVIAMMPMTVFAAEDDGTFKDSNGIRYLITGENTVSVVSDTDDSFLGDQGIGKGQATYKGEITIPATVTDGDNTYTVTEIGGMTFYWTDITKITIPSSVTRIDSLAFYNCHSLTEIIIPDSGLLEIGNNAFESCDKLSSFSLPSTVTTIGTAAFGDCRELKSLHIPAGVTDGLVKALVGNTLYPYLENVTIEEGSPYEIEDGVLYRGTEAHLYVGPDTDVVLREGTTKIADDQYNSFSGIMGAFAQTYDLKSITIPEGVTSIPANAFNSAVNLESVTLPDGLQEIGTRAFYNTGLLSIELPDSVETIGSSAFQGTIHMTSAKLPSNLKSMGEGAFCDAYVLESIVIPEGVTEIPAEAFAGCIALKSITLPNGLTTIGNYAFDLTTRVGSDYINPSPQLEYINIPSTVTSLGENFLGGLKADGETLLISQVADPGVFTEAALAGISGDRVNAPTIYYPAEAKDAYTGENSPLKDLLPPDEATEGKQDYTLELPESAQVKAGESLALTVVSELPDGAVLNFNSENSDIAAVNNGTITGVAAGTTTITASILLNGVVLASDECKVTVVSDIVYLNGTSGNDTNSGADADNAVKTLEKALEMVADDGTIYVCGEVTIASDLVISDVSIKRADGYNGKMLTLQGTTNAPITVTMENVTIDGNKENVPESNHLVNVSYDANLIMKDGTVLQNNGYTALLVSYGSGESRKPGHVVMEGGQITGNTAPEYVNGGGIHIQGNFEMTGGEISENQAAYGGGIHIDGGTVSFSGGEIKGNTATIQGGGVSVVRGSFTMEGTASITGNTSIYHGAGVYIDNGSSSGDSIFEMKSGVISGNSIQQNGYVGAGIFGQNNSYGSRDVIIRISGGEISGQEGDSRLITLYSERTAYPNLELSGSPDIKGGVFLWDGAYKDGFKLHVTGAFNPAAPITIERQNTISGIIAVEYAQGVTPNKDDFTSYNLTNLLTLQGQTLMWTEANAVRFYDEDGTEFTDNGHGVLPGELIDAVKVPTLTKTGYTLMGWYEDGAEEPWDFGTDMVQKDTELYARWSLNVPDVDVKADVNNPHEGTSAILTATPSHDLANLTYTYQWYKDGTPLTGETGNQLTVSETGRYTVKVVASDGSKISAEAESAPVEITVDGHVYVPVMTKPTCTEQGYTTHTCEICGDSYVDSYIEPTGHSFAAWVSDANNHWKECESCGIKADEAAHTFAWVTDREATATEAGSRHEECTVCGYEKAAVEIPATGTSAGGGQTGDTTSPQTGDDSNLALWIVVMLAAGAALTGTAVYSRKRKYSR